MPLWTTVIYFLKWSEGANIYFFLLKAGLIKIFIVSYCVLSYSFVYNTYYRVLKIYSFDLLKIYNNIVFLFFDCDEIQNWTTLKLVLSDS